MSLINDALKRARQFQRQQQAQSMSSDPVPVPMARPHDALPWALPLLVILLITGAITFFGMAFFHRKPAVQLTAPVSFQQSVPPAPVAANPAPPATVAVPQVNNGKAALTPGQGAKTVSVTVPAPPPALKLQGISYSNDKWQAIVNGATVSVGDNVKGFTVKAISRDNVSFVAPDGSQKKLALGD